MDAQPLLGAPVTKPEDPAPGGQNCSPEEPSPIKTYSLEEVAEMVLPADMANAVRWLQTQLLAGKASGYKAGRKWRMTQSDVEDFVARHRNSSRPLPPPPPAPDYGGLSRRSWLSHQRPRRPAYRGPAVEHQKVRPPGADFVKVHPESAEAIAAMRPMTKTQQDLLNRVQTEGEVTLNGTTARKTVEALAKRGLVEYEAEYVLNETHLYLFYRFTIRLMR